MSAVARTSRSRRPRTNRRAPSSAGTAALSLFGPGRYRVEIDLRLPNRTSPAFAIRGGAAGLRGAADRTLRLPVIRLRPRALSDAPSFVALHDVLVPIQSDEALLA